MTPSDVVETPDVKIAQHVGFLTLRLIALEHERERLLARLAALEAAPASEPSA